jgi:hypothetical protein
VHGWAGLVTAAELRKLLSNCDSAIDSSTIEDSFVKFDQDHTGKIGFYQFLRMFRQHLIDLEVIVPGTLLPCFRGLQPCGGAQWICRYIQTQLAELLYDLQSVVAYLHKPVPAESTSDAPSPPPAAGVEPGQVGTVNFHCMSQLAGRRVQGVRQCIYAL